MIRPPIVREVRRLLAAGNLSQRKIAGLTGVSRGTVAAIAAGKRREHDAPRPTADDEPLQPGGPLERCPGCGGMVYMPCRSCQARAQKARSPRQPVPRWAAQLDEPLGLDLRAADRARYEEVRLARTNAAALHTPGNADRAGATSPNGQSDLCGAFEPDDDTWELDPADLWDAFDWEDDEPAIDYADEADESLV